MEFGKLVLYTEFGRTYPALVVGSRELEHHGGENDEPLVNLVFVREVKDGSGNVVPVSGTSREAELIQFRHDVAHESHEFTEEQKKELSDKGLLPPGGSIPGGRYVEAVYSQAFRIPLAGGGVAQIGIAPVPETPNVPVASAEGEALTGEASAPAVSAVSSEPATAESAEAAGDAEEKPVTETVQ